MRYSGAGGYFHDAGGNRVACVIIGLDDCPFIDDAILVETPSCKGATIERADFHPHGRKPNTPVTDAEPSTPANTRAQSPRSV